MLVVPGAPRIFSRKLRISLRRPGQAHARREAAVADGRERVGDAGIAGIEDACRRAGEDVRLRAGDEGRDLVVFLRPGRDAIPAKAVVEGEVRAGVPAILREEAGVFVAGVEGIELALVVLAGNADEEVGEVDAGFGAGEDKVAVELGDGVGVDLVGVKLAAEFEGVVAEHLGEGIGDLVGVVGLDELIGRGAGGVAVEVEVLDALAVGIERRRCWGCRRRWRSPARPG